jgi:GNAT superfamily N-acetyltransferase
MIKTKLTREDALEIMKLGKQLHQESRFKDQVFNEDRCWRILERTIHLPHTDFIAFDDQYRGFILMAMSEEFFSGQKWSADRSLYIAPEFRGSSLVVRLIDAAETWSKEQGAQEMVIFHNTGIDTDKAPRLFNKLGFDMKGYIFSKEIKQCVA